MKHCSLLQSIGLAGEQQQFAMQKPFDFQRMAAERMAYGHEPIGWKQILLNQLRAESYGRSLNDVEKFILESLSG